MSKVVILLEDGLVSEVVSDSEVEVRIVDRDIEGLDKEDIIQVEERDAYIYQSIQEASQNKERTERIFNQIDEQGK